MAEEKRGWKQFRELTFDSRKFSKGVKKAEGATVRHAHKFILTRLDNIRSVRRHIVGWLLLVGAMIVAVGVQFMWFQQSYQTVAAARGGTYAEASLGPIDTLNPLYASSSAEVAASRLLFSSLYSYDTTGHLHSDLAENMQVDASNTIYTVVLRTDAAWQDGTRLTANDVAFTVNLIKNAETRSPLRATWQDIKVKAIDDKTIQFQLPAVYAAFSNALTFSVLPEHLLGKVAPGAVRENTFSHSPVGSGPFSFNLLQTIGSSAQKHKIVHLTAYNKYYGGTPLLSRFEVHSYDTQEAIANALRTGEVSAADLTGTDVSQVDTHNYDITGHPINSGVYALFNVETPILKDKAVRQALGLATDTVALRKSLPVKTPMLDLPFVNGQITGTDIPHPAASNVVEATALLDKAGWVLQKDGIRRRGDQKLELTIATTKSIQYEKALESLAGQWRKLGVIIHTNIVNTADPATNFVQNILQARNYDVLLYELSIGGDPDVYAYWHSSQIGMRGYNFSNYANPISDSALASARSRLEPDLRNAKYKTFAKQWIEDIPAIGLYQPVAQYVSNKHVAASDKTAKFVSSYDRYANILDWSVNQKSVYKTP